MTTCTGLLDWLDDPEDGCGIDFAGQGDAWNHMSYGSLAERVHRVAEGLERRGLTSGDRLVIALSSGPEFVTTLFGALRLGATVTPISPPALLGDLHGYLDQVRGILARTAPAALVTSLEHRDLLVRGALKELLSFTPEELLADAPTRDRSNPAPGDALALIQFTSGSTGRSRGIPLTVRTVESNLKLIADWLGMQAGDTTGSWLPVHHDMGLIGCLLTPVVHRTGIRLLTPEQFVRSPARYLRSFGAEGCTLSAMPTFGLRHIASRVKAEQLEGCDFSDWRALIVGAERIDPQVLRSFTDLLSPFGFTSRALLPAYGLAEATLAVTGVRLTDEWSSVRLDHGSTVPGERVTRVADGVELPSSGSPLPTCTVTIVDDDGKPLPEGVVGEIQVDGLSVGTGYLPNRGDAQESAPSSFTAAGIRTGDAGFLAGGELHVLGRLGDALKVRGRTLFAEEVELAIASHGIAPGRTVALLGEAHGTPTIVVAVENPPAGWEEHVCSEVRRLAPGAATVPLPLPRGAIARTTSGKPRRRLLWEAYLHGDLPPERARTEATPRPEGVSA